MELSLEKYHIDSSQRQLPEDSTECYGDGLYFQDTNQSQATYDASWSPTLSNQDTSTPWIQDCIPSPSPPPSPAEPPPPHNRSIYPLQTRPGFRVTVVPYNPLWPSQFTTIQDHLHNIFTHANPPAPYTSIEHIGSTSIPDLAAKPNIDVLVTLPDRRALNAAVEALDWELPTTPPFTRYTKVPNGGGIQGRESFKLYVPLSSEYYYSTPERSVYLIDESEANPAGRVQIRGYRALRETLKDPANHDLLIEYADVKFELGERTYQHSITYSELKNHVVRKILRRAGWTEEEIDEKERLSARTLVDDEPPY